MSRGQPSTGIPLLTALNFVEDLGRYPRFAPYEIGHNFPYEARLANAPNAATIGRCEARRYRTIM